MRVYASFYLVSQLKTPTKFRIPLRSRQKWRKGYKSEGNSPNVEARARRSGRQSSPPCLAGKQPLNTLADSKPQGEERGVRNPSPSEEIYK